MSSGTHHTFNSYAEYAKTARSYFPAVNTEGRSFYLPPPPRWQEDSAFSGQPARVQFMGHMIGMAVPRCAEQHVGMMEHALEGGAKRCTGRVFPAFVRFEDAEGRSVRPSLFFCHSFEFDRYLCRVYAKGKCEEVAVAKA